MNCPIPGGCYSCNFHRLVNEGRVRLAVPPKGIPRAVLVIDPPKPPAHRGWLRRRLRVLFARLMAAVRKWSQKYR